MKLHEAIIIQLDLKDYRVASRWFKQKGREPVVELHRDEDYIALWELDLTVDFKRRYKEILNDQVHFFNYMRPRDV